MIGKSYFSVKRRRKSTRRRRRRRATKTMAIEINEKIPEIQILTLTLVATFTSLWRLFFSCTKERAGAPGHFPVLSCLSTFPQSTPHSSLLHRLLFPTSTMFEVCTPFPLSRKKKAEGSIAYTRLDSRRGPLPSPPPPRPLRRPHLR